MRSLEQLNQQEILRCAQDDRWNTTHRQELVLHTWLKLTPMLESPLQDWITRGETMNTAQVLVELLKEYRVEHIFGVPGDTTMPLYDALYAARDEITHIMARDERSAAFMDDAYARLTHKPGITEAPSGGGATYVIPGVAEAN